MARILMLSPMQAMAERAAIIAAELGIELSVAVVYDDAAAVAAIRRETGVEVVVTRGGLVEGVRHVAGISVVPITMSMNELLHLLTRLAAEGTRRVAIVSRENLLDGAVGNFQLPGLTVSIRSCRDEAQIRATVADLVARGFEAVIGCRMSCEAASAHGVTTVFLESGEQAIRAALQEAVRILHAREEKQRQAAQLKAIIDNIGEGVVAVSPDNTISFHNEPARALCADADGATDFRALLAACGTRAGEQIVALGEARVVARRIPLAHQGEKSGDIITFEEVSRIQASETRIRLASQRKGLVAHNSFEDIITQNAAIRGLIEKARRYAAFDANVLIQGETGTGKELFAQGIHNHSPSCNGPFVSVNTASIAPGLLESELFGYAEGAFTGARRGGKPGLFELAHHGTLFLDEIGELSPDIQSRLLRVLQEKEVMRIGDDKIIPVDVRIVCATHRNLAELIRQGRFREDLYYRIHVLGLRIPPLRSRREDIPLLFAHHLAAVLPAGSGPARLREATAALLMRQEWPGNVRQLRNIAERIACQGIADVHPAHIEEALQEQDQLPSPVPQPIANALPLPENFSLKEVEALVIRHLLDTHSIEEVCTRLGISRVTLWRKLGGTNRAAWD